MGFLDFLFGNKNKQIKELLDQGAVIVDVRTKAEWDRGHISNSKHIPLDELKNHVKDLQKLNKPIITCCASGMRSGKAAQYLNLKNIAATNGGGWLSLKNKL